MNHVCMNEISAVLEVIALGGCVCPCSHRATIAQKVFWDLIF